MLKCREIQDIFELIITRQNILDYESKIIDLKECKIFTMECELKRVNQGKTLIIGSQNVQKNEGVIKLLKQAWRWCEDIEKGVAVKEIAERENISSSYINKVLKMILTGENRDLLTSHILRKVISTNFQEQERELGI